jgi:SOS-response transcriptional repressor LexA
MKKQITIGPAVLRRRRELGWSMQRLCDETGGAIYTGYLSDIEKENSNPSVDKAYAIAAAFGTSIDKLIEESISPNAALAPSEHARRVPIVPWELAHEWAQNPDISRLPSGTPWEVPLDSQATRGFFLSVRDESMHAPAGPAFPAGALIFVDPAQEARVNDFIVGYTSDPTAPTFKKLVQDGSQSYLRALNPQFPVTQIDGNFRTIGVVIGMVMKTSRGIIR